MDKPIAVGDLVQVVRGCCAVRLGKVWTVEKIVNLGNFTNTACDFCGAPQFGLAAGNWTVNEGAPLSFLKRIPPLSELEGVKSQELLKEPYHVHP